MFQPTLSEINICLTVDFYFCDRGNQNCFLCVWGGGWGWQVGRRKLIVLYFFCSSMAPTLKSIYLLFENSLSFSKMLKLVLHSQPFYDVYISKQDSEHAHRGYRLEPPFLLYVVCILNISRQCGILLFKFVLLCPYTYVNYYNHPIFICKPLSL